MCDTLGKPHLWKKSNNTLFYLINNSNILNAKINNCYREKSVKIYKTYM